MDDENKIVYSKIYEPFEKCKGLNRVLDDDRKGWMDLYPDEIYSYCYQVAGFKNVYIVYNYDRDEVMWIQYILPSFTAKFRGKKILKIIKGVRMWESMRPEHQKLFLFNLDWFLGE